MGRVMSERNQKENKQKLNKLIKMWPAQTSTNPAKKTPKRKVLGRDNPKPLLFVQPPFSKKDIKNNSFTFAHSVHALLKQKETHLFVLSHFVVQALFL